MRTLRRTVTADRLTISTRCGTQSKISRIEVENLLPIPVDLNIEILSRLPAKSLAICRCVSKLWGSIICSQYFTELFLTRSLNRPQLLFSIRKDGNMFFFSTPQLQNPPAENLTASSLMSFPFSSQISIPIHGLICLARERNQREGIAIVICNPSTGKSLNLPKPMIRSSVSCFLVYEPIKKQFKVLLSSSVEHQVLTLGTGELSWRKIECSMPHVSKGNFEICINGILYYPATAEDDTIVCFDVSSEEFNFITSMEDFSEVEDRFLINYNGKLALLAYKLPKSIIKLWILQDAEKQVWSKHTYVVPVRFEDIFETATLDFLGVTCTNEIMLAKRYIEVPFYVFYFNMEKKKMKRVAIHGMEAFQGHRVLTFFDHVENVKLMDHMF